MRVVSACPICRFWYVLWFVRKSFSLASYFFGMPSYFVGGDKAYSWHTTIGDEALGAVRRCFKKHIVDVLCLMDVELVVG